MMGWVTKCKELHNSESDTDGSSTPILIDGHGNKGSAVHLDSSFLSDILLRV